MIAPADHIDQIMAVMDAAFDPAFAEAWSRRQVEDALILGNCQAVLIDAAGQTLSAGGAAAGFALLRRSLDEAELLLFAVAPDHRRKGLGTRMLDLMTAQARDDGITRIFLEMREGNPADALYRGYGFQVIGRRPNYYHLPDNQRRDAITFALDLTVTS